MLHLVRTDTVTFKVRVDTFTDSDGTCRQMAGVVRRPVTLYEGLDTVIADIAQTLRERAAAWAEQPPTEALEEEPEAAKDNPKADAM